MRAHWLTDPIMVEDGGVEGYTSSTYGDAFADVYDRWYHDLDDVPAAVAALAALTPPGGHVLELGVGTGRLAIPLAIALDARAATVTGIDSSGPMLERLAANDAGALVRMVRGDMVDALPHEPIDVALLAYNTLFNLLSAARQEACLAAIAGRLSPSGIVVIEAFVPDDDSAPRRHDVGLRSMTSDEVVLSVSRATRDDQCIEGQYITISEAGGVRLRPWAIRWATPDQLDEMAARTGLVRLGRWSSLGGERYDEHSARHVSIYGTAGAARETTTRVRKVLG